MPCVGMDSKGNVIIMIEVLPIGVLIAIEFRTIGMFDDYLFACILIGCAHGNEPRKHSRMGL